MKILLGTFKENGDELAAFLEPRVGAKPLVGGDELSFDDDQIKKGMKARHVKTYVKRFLNKKGERQNYRILVEGTELRLIELEQLEEEEEEEVKKKEAVKAEKVEEKEEETEAKPAEPEEKEETDEAAAETEAKKDE